MYTFKITFQKLRGTAWPPDGNAYIYCEMLAGENSHMH